MFGSAGAPLSSATVPAHADFVIYKDGKAFLIVNGTVRHAESVLASLRHHSTATFTMERD